jgi:hypothetical protein
LMEPTLRARLRAGDPDAFGALFDGCAQAVYNHAFRLTGDWSVAEDPPWRVVRLPVPPQCSRCGATLPGLPCRAGIAGCRWGRMA